MDNPNFKLSKENELKATKEELEFILSQASEFLKQELSSADSVVNRSIILLTLLIGILTSVIAWLFNNKEPFITPIYADFVITSIYIAIIIVKIYYILSGTVYKVSGSQPKYLFHDWYFENYPKHDERNRQLIIGEINSYQDRIEHNNLINTKKWNAFETCIAMSLFVPIVFVVVALILNVASPLFGQHHHHY